MWLRSSYFSTVLESSSLRRNTWRHFVKIEHTFDSPAIYFKLLNYFIKIEDEKYSLLFHIFIARY